MNRRTTLVLALLAAIVTAVAWEDARNTELHFQKDLDQPHRFPDSAVVALAVERPGFTVALERSESGWRIVAPVAYPASPVSVETIVRLVRELRVRGEGPGTLSAAGIAPDSARLRLEVRGAGRIELTFGAAHPTLPYRYCALGEQVVLIDPIIAEAIEALALDDLRSEALCDVPLARADRLVVERGTERIAVSREGEEWRLEGTGGGDAESHVVRRAIESLNAWAAHSFVADAVGEEAALAEYGLAEPGARIEVRERGTGRTVRLRIGDRTDLPEGGGEGLFVLVESTRTVVRATAAILASLPATETLRSRLLVRVPEPDIVAVRVVGDYRRVDLQLTEDGEWLLHWAGDGTPHPADRALFGRMLESIRGATVDRFIALDEHNLRTQGFDRPALELVFLRASGEREELIVGAELPGEPGFSHVRNPRWGGAAVAAVPDLAAWRRAPFSLRSAAAIPIPPEAVRRIRLVPATGGVRELVRPHEEWRAAGADPAEPLPADLRAALAALPRLRGGGWEASAPTPPGPRQHRFAVELLPLDGDPSEPWLRLWVGPEEADGRLIRVGDEGWLLRAPRSPFPDPFPALERYLERP